MRIVSWNILAQPTVPEHLRETHDWKLRLPHIIGYLLKTNADIICLQEVLMCSFLNDFEPVLDRYCFAHHGVCVYKGKRKNESFGNVTFWKPHLITSDIRFTKRCLHVKLLCGERAFVVSNVHFPAAPGKEGYLLKSSCLNECSTAWDTETVLLCGDYNCGLAYMEDNKHAGLHSDLTNNRFVIPEEELTKQTCKSFRGNVHNVDHVLARAIEVHYIDQELDVNKQFPSDHLPILYRV